MFNKPGFLYKRICLYGVCFQEISSRAANSTKQFKTNPVLQTPEPQNSLLANRHVSFHISVPTGSL